MSLNIFQLPNSYWQGVFWPSWERSGRGECFRYSATVVNGRKRYHCLNCTLLLFTQPANPQHYSPEYAKKIDTTYVVPDFALLLIKMTKSGQMTDIQVKILSACIYLGGKGNNSKSWSLNEPKLKFCSVYEGPINANDAPRLETPQKKEHYEEYYASAFQYRPARG